MWQASKLVGMYCGTFMDDQVKGIGPGVSLLFLCVHAHAHVWVWDEWAGRHVLHFEPTWTSLSNSLNLITSRQNLLQTGPPIGKLSERELLRYRELVWKPR